MALARCGFLVLTCFAAVDAFFFHRSRSHRSRHGLTASTSSHRKLLQTTPVLASQYSGTAGFFHGVASGGPLPDKVFIWTRWTPEVETENVELSYRIVAVEDGFEFSQLGTGMHELLMSSNAFNGTILASSTEDWTTKVEVGGLAAGTTWIFCFVGPGGVSSRTGMTKTAPAADDDAVSEVNYAIFSCSQLEAGYFHAYNTAAYLDKLDFWLHLGDYIYESGNPASDPIRTGAEWSLDPPTELLSLADYRRRYAQYHTDEALQNLRARAPMVAIWDDHEFANDVHSCGADAHNPGDGNFSTRVNEAAQAWREWMPVRAGTLFEHTGAVRDMDVSQVVEWGKLATLAAFDTRVKARTPMSENAVTALLSLVANHTDINDYTKPPVREALLKIAADDAAVRADASNVMMGAAQLEALEDTFRQSKAAGKQWQLLATGTVFAKIVYPDLMQLPPLAGDSAAAVSFLLDAAFADAATGDLARATVAGHLYNISINTDSWDGFVAERDRVLQIFKEHCNNAVVYSGDSHDSWAFSLLDDEEAQRGPPVAVNIAVPSVSAAGLGPNSPPLYLVLGADGWAITHRMWEDSNPSMRYSNTKDKGFVKVSATSTHHTAEFVFVTDDLDSVTGNFDTFQTRPYADFPGSLAPARCGARFTTTAGDPGSLARSDCSTLDSGTDTSQGPTTTTPPPVPAETASHAASSFRMRWSWLGCAATAAAVGYATVSLW